MTRTKRTLMLMLPSCQAISYGLYTTNTSAKKKMFPYEEAWYSQDNLELGQKIDGRQLKKPF